MVKDQSAGIYEKAIQNQNVARALTDQADVAKEALKALAAEALASLRPLPTPRWPPPPLSPEQQAQRDSLPSSPVWCSAEPETEADYAIGVEGGPALLPPQRPSPRLATAPRQAKSSAGWARPTGMSQKPYGYRIQSPTAATMRFTPAPPTGCRMRHPI
jgi:hypothetical protein